MDKKVKYTLKYPFEFNGEQWTELHFRTRIKAKDTIRMAKAKARHGLEGEVAEEAQGFGLFASLAGVPDEIFEEVDLEDIDAIAAIVNPDEPKKKADETTDSTPESPSSNHSSS